MNRMLNERDTSLLRVCLRDILSAKETYFIMHNLARRGINEKHLSKSQCRIQIATTFDTQTWLPEGATLRCSNRSIDDAFDVSFLAIAQIATYYNT